MKKYVFTALIALFLSQKVTAQIEDYRIGVKLAPTVSYVRASTDGNSTTFERNGSTVKFLIGAFVDIPFKDNYYFHTGINYASRNTKVTATDAAYFGGTPTSAEYDHEYIQLPALIKLYTNEVLLDTKLFFNFGVIPEVRLNTNNKTENINLITEFQHFDINGNFGGGVERAIGVQTSLFASINYNIGFINQVKEQSNSLDDLKVKNSLIAIEFGIKF
ncbi:MULTISPECIES: outer membrane beta-barrel protein [Roseivirga]|jgi:hypothetical protein|uniref:Outer membrane protein beta-barrel domain-containing protein n=1 Tax=Roseivirga thermotolerans TaxID=1758176 RepID=A0ABQ3I740_9BACT|nr:MULTISPECIES: outer membrane beta-barrel protein [Roseivirga]MEC7755163.1 porin family protein [Bacteroidota bacterium]GHE55861.1 hypothetical protein GCM10011340_08300 [Roseivirga thermotolerans]|tara:strand:- start:8441 stop:9094 length:654 start_codon:yes stop_codon:yes gene_type:complete